MFGPALRSGLVSGVASLGGPASSPCHRGYTGVGSRPVRARCKSDIRVKGAGWSGHSHAIDAACRAGDDGYDDMFIKINGRGTNRNYEV